MKKHIREMNSLDDMEKAICRRKRMDTKEAIEVLTKASCSAYCISGEDGCSAYNCEEENCRLRQATIMAVELLKAKAEEE